MLVLITILILLTSCSNKKSPTQDDVIFQKNLIITELEDKIRDLQSNVTTLVTQDEDTLLTQIIIEVEAIVLKASTDSINNAYDDLKGPWAFFYTPDFKTTQALFFNTEGVTTMVLEESQEVILEIKLSIYSNGETPSTSMKLLNIINP